MPPTATRGATTRAEEEEEESEGDANANAQTKKKVEDGERRGGAGGKEEFFNRCKERPREARQEGPASMNEESPKDSHSPAPQPL